MPRPLFLGIMPLSLILAACTSPALSQEAPVADLSVSGLRATALRAMQKGDAEAAKRAADALIREHSKDPRAARVAGDVYLRSGKVAAAVEQFDRYLEMEPAALPELWQRGIAFVLRGRFQTRRATVRGSPDDQPERRRKCCMALSVRRQDGQPAACQRTRLAGAERSPDPDGTGAADADVRGDR